VSDRPEKKAPGGLAQRAVTGVVLAVGVLVLIWSPNLFERVGTSTFEGNSETVFRFRTSFLANYGFTIAAAIFVAIGFREYAAMARAKGIVLPSVAGSVAVAFIVFITGFLGLAFGLNALGIAVFAAIVSLALLHILRGMDHHTLPGLAATIFGVVYLGWMPAHLVLMHVSGYTGLEPLGGPGLVTMLIAMVAMSDTGAYFTGRAIGKHKLAPLTSPKKTWEGAAGGLVAAILTGAVIYGLRDKFQFGDLPDYPLLWFLATGAVLSVVSQIGDLVESMLKRDAGIKDSGNIFPGHGGVLDRCDGILFAAPALYYLLQLELAIDFVKTGIAGP